MNLFHTSVSLNLDSVIAHAEKKKKGIIGLLIMKRIKCRKQCNKKNTVTEQRTI